MGFLNNLFHRAAPSTQAKGEADGGYAYLWNAESNASPDVDQSNYLLAYQVSLWTQRCVEAIATACAAVTMQLFNAANDEEVEKHELLQTLRYVNSQDDLPWLIAATVGYQLLSGNAYWLLDQPNKPSTIYNLRPDWVSVKPLASGLRYEYRIGGKGAKQLLPDGCVIHFRQWNPVNSLYGQPTIQAAETSINLDKAIREFNAAFMRNSAVPAGLISVEGSLDDAQKTAAREAFQRNYGGGKNAGKTIFLGGGKWQWQQLGNLNKDGGYSAEAKLVREEILAAFAVPPVKVGLLDGATFANSREQERIFWESTILGGHMQQLLGRLNQGYVTRWPDAQDYELRPDRNKIAALQEDRKELFARLQPAVGGPWLKPNEAREMAGLEPYEGGDKLYSGGGFGGGFLSDPEPKPALPAKGVVRPFRRKADLHYGEFGSLPHIEFMKSFETQLRRQEKPLARALGKANAALVDEVIAKLEAQERSFRQAKATVPSVMAVLFDVDEAGNVYSKTIMPYIESTIEAGASRVLAELNSEVWDVQRPEVVAWLKDKELQVRTLPKTMHEELRGIVQQGVKDGVSAGEIAQRIQDAKPGYETFKAERVARTETIGANNYGALECYGQNGATLKEWVTALDDKVRDGTTGEFDHTAAHGEAVELKAAFEATGESLAFPGDPMGSAGNIINCRCALVSGD